MRYPVTAGVALMAIAVTVLSSKSHSVDALVMNVQAFEGQPWRLLTSALPHADAIHLVFNVVWLWVFGTILEDAWGHVSTFAVFALFAAGSTLAEYALVGSGIGLSGVGYGLLALLAVLARRDRRFADAMDRRTLYLFAGWFVFCVLMTVTGVMRIGNVAHGAGAILGVLLALVVSPGPLVTRITGGAGIATVLAASLAGATIYRPLVNFSAGGGADSAQLGYELLGSGDNAEAVRHLHRALAISPNDDIAWHNLALGLGRLGDSDGAIAGYRRAYALQSTRDNKRALAGALLDRGIDLAKAKDNAGALKLYRESLELDASNAIGWYDISIAYDHIGDHAAALEAARKAATLDPTQDHKQWVEQLEADSGSAPVANPAQALAQRYEDRWTAWNANAWTKFGDCFARGAVVESPGSGQSAHSGRDAIVKQAATEQKVDMPDARADVGLVLVSGSTVVGLVALHGHGAAGKAVGIALATVDHFDDTCVIDHEWTYMDSLTLIRQITPDPPHVARSPIDKPPMTHTVVIANDDAAEQTNARALDALLAAYDQHDAKAWDAMLADDVVWSDAAEPTDRNKKTVIRDVQPIWQAMSDARLTATSTWAAGDYVAAVVTFDGTNDRDSSLHAKTGKKASLPEWLVVRLDHGRVKAGWILYQSASLFSQLGWGDDVSIGDVGARH